MHSRCLELFPVLVLTAGITALAGGSAPAQGGMPGGTPAGASPPNRAPVALYVRPDAFGTSPGGALRFEALAIDPDGDRLIYEWSATAGSFAGLEGPLVDWSAPGQPGEYSIRVRVTDPSGASLQTQVQVQVTRDPIQFNQPPFVDRLVATDLTPMPGQTVHLTLKASDPDADALKSMFYFFDTSARLASPNELDWTAPSRAGIYPVYGLVNDGRGGYGWARQELSVNSFQTLDRSHRSYGRAGQLLTEFGGYMLWVGIDDPVVAQLAQALAARKEQRFVLGRVVPDPAQRHGFYLDPASVRVVEVTAEGIQTTIEQVSRNPAFYAPGGGGGFDLWALSSRLLQFVPAP